MSSKMIFCPHLQFLVKGIFLQKVAAQAAHPTDAVGVFALFGIGEALADAWAVGHFEGVGHVGGERAVEVGGLDALVVHDVQDGGDQGARFPSDGAARLQDDLQVRVSPAEFLKRSDQMLHVVAFFATAAQDATSYTPLHRRFHFDRVAGIG